MKRSILVIFVVVTALLYLPSSGNLNATTVTIVSYCTNLQTLSTVTQGTSSNITFTCGSTPAFKTTQPTATRPSFSLPPGYTAIYANGTVTIRLRSGFQTFVPQGNYTYLAQYDGSTTGTLSSFTVSWASNAP